MRRKKILIFIDWYLPGYRAGGPIQSCANLIAHLKNDCDFSVVTRITDYRSDTPYDNVRPDEWNVSNDGTRVYYFSKAQLTRNNIKHLLDSEVFDTAYLNGIFSKQFTLIPLRYLQRKSKPVIIAVRGMLAPGALAQKKLKKRLFLLYARAAGTFDNVIFHVSNEEEGRQVHSIFGPAAVVKLAPNLPGKLLFSNEKQKIKKEAGELRLISLARIAPEKNTKFALECLQGVKSKVLFDLYGPVYNKNYWNECRNSIALLPSHVKVNYKGALDSNLIPETLSKYHFFFLPTLGENFGHAILQSFSAGLPVIISDQTMWKNLQSKKAGWDIPLSNRYRFTEVIEECINMDQHEYTSLSNGAREVADSYLNNEANLRLNRELFLNL